jgi:hypothetical protein
MHCNQVCKYLAGEKQSYRRMFISDVFGTSMLVGEKKPTNKQIEEYRKDRIEVLKKALSETRD